MPIGPRIGLAPAAILLIALAGCGGTDESQTSEQASGRIALRQLGDFDRPDYLTQPTRVDPEHVYVVEVCGRILRVPIDGGDATVFLDLRSRVSCGGEQGLFSVAFDPDYAESGRLYVDYTDTAGDSRVVEYRRSASEPTRADPRSAREILTVDQPYINHNGGLVVFGPDGELYTGFGDGGGEGDPDRTAQDPETPLGKLLRLDPDRPGSWEPVATGLRNPWRFSFAPRTGDLWIGDVGQGDWEEVDVVPANQLASGSNFGWSAYEGTMRFNRDQRAPGAIAPIHQYSHSRGCSITGGYVVEDPELPALDGRYLYGDLCTGELRSFTADPSRSPNDDRALGLEVPSLSSFGRDAAGHLYAISIEGPVYRLIAAG